MMFFKERLIFQSLEDFHKITCSLFGASVIQFHHFPFRSKCLSVIPILLAPQISDSLVRQVSVLGILYIKLIPGIWLDGGK